MRRKRAAMSEEDKEENRKKDAERKRNKKANMTEEEALELKKKDARRKSSHKSHVNPRDGLRSCEVLQGKLQIKKLLGEYSQLQDASPAAFVLSS